MKRLIFLAVAALAGCAGLPAADNPQYLLSDKLFKPAAAPIRPGELFTLSPAMRDYVARHITGRNRGPAARDALMEALHRDIRLDYDAGRTRTAAEAFDARAGNCLSLVIMTAALARELSIPVTFQTVYGEDTWTRASGMAFHSGHVNLLLGTARLGEWLNTQLDSSMVVDFLPASEVGRHISRPLPQETVVAMYLNNRAAETLAEGDTDTAYWWAREAVRAAPGFLSALNTLGVVYRRHGDLMWAERAFRYVLERDRENPQVLSNLAQVVAAQGRAEEARTLRLRLAEIQPYPPFYFLDRGLAAMKRGDADTALSWFLKEQARMPYDDEVDFAIALANLHLGQKGRAQQYLASALENSTTRERRQIYAAKLEYLKSLQ